MNQDNTTNIDYSYRRTKIEAGRWTHEEGRIVVKLIVRDLPIWNLRKEMGTMSTKKSGSGEEEYFAREELARREQATIKKQDDERESRQKLHYMKCPKCGENLETTVLRDVEIDVCTGCKGVWLDVGELETLSSEKSHVFRDMFAIFKNK